jgi:hypothetical protein
MRVATDAEPVERIGDRKDAIHARIEADVVVVSADACAADGYLVCELREEVVEVGEGRGREGGRGARRGFGGGRLVIGRG